MARLSRSFGILTALTFSVAVVAAPEVAAAQGSTDEAEGEVGYTWDRKGDPRTELLPDDFVSAPTLEEAAPEIGWSGEEVNDFRDDIARRFSDDLRQELGIESAETQAALSVDDYVEAEDLDSYVLPETPPGETHLLTVSAGTLVDVNGDVFPAPTFAGQHAQDPPIEFVGDWDPDTYDLSHQSLTIEDSGIGDWPFCSGKTVGEVRSRTHYVQADESVDGNYWYYGLFRDTTAEIVEGSGGIWCQDFIRSFEADARIALLDPYHIYVSPSLWDEYVDQSPLPGDISNVEDCDPVSVSVSQFGFSIGSTFDRCDDWSVKNPTSQYPIDDEFGLVYSNGGRCDSSTKSARSAVIFRRNAGVARLLGIELEGDPDHFRTPRVLLRHDISPGHRDGQVLVCT